MAGKNGLSLHADDLRAMGKDVAEVLQQLDPKKAEELRYNYRFWARPEQVPPEEGEWNVFLALAGRGWGKTWAGAQWCREQVKLGKRRVMAVAATNADLERVLVKGESGFLSVCWVGDKTYKGVHMGYPEWSPTKRTLTWANGATVTFYSSEEPDRLRGPQGDAAWLDELCAWNKDRETYDMLQFCLRLGKHPRIFITTTPKPTRLLRDILKSPKTLTVRGSTFDNAANLASTYLEAVKTQYEGTRLGRQELYAEVLDEAAGALWNRSILETCEVEIDDPIAFSETLARVVVAVDPAVSANAESDMTGIVVAGMDINGVCYVLEDATERLSPEGWATKAVNLFHKYHADRLVYERNQGGDLVKYTLKTVDETIPLKAVHASRGKFARAEPVAALYERGKVKHLRGLDDLETQMTTWEPLGSIGSPDRLDAMVWAITELALKGISRPELNLAYSDAKGLLGRL
jgi:phage terminase large subunit-like protein